jgi:hypothetical protein
MKTFCLLTAACLLAAFAQTSVAATVNGFEPGDPAVTSTGDAGVKGTYQGVVPPQGANQYLLTTINANGVDGTDGYSNQSSSNAVLNSALQTFVLPGSILTGTEGSAVKLSVVVPVGFDTITFQYDFLTNELPSGSGVVQHQDFGFAYLVNTATNLTVGGLRSVATPASINFNDPARQLPTGAIATNPFSFDSGYQTFTISGLAAGTYALNIGVEDKTTSDTPSGLLLDNVSVSSAQAVPEPSTFGLIIAGAASFAAVRRRIKKTV